MLKIGIVGIGGISNVHHLEALQSYPDIEVTALCDIQVGRAEKAREVYFPNARVYSDYMEMMDAEKLDVVDICTPNYLHSRIAVEALNRKIHVFCEKPDAISVSEAQRMKEAAEKNDCHLMVMRNNRYLSSSGYLKNLAKKGELGELYAGRCGWIRRRGIPGKGGWFTTKEQSGGGPLIDLGVHMIDLAIWLMGNPTPISVSGCTFCKFADTNASDSVHSSFGEAKNDGIFDVEDLAMGFIRFENGTCLQIEFSWASNIETELNFVELRGTKGGITWHNGDVKVFTEEEGILIDKILPNLPAINGHRENIHHFLNVVQGKTEPNFKPLEGVNMIKILEAMYLSAETGREVSL